MNSGIQQRRRNTECKILRILSTRNPKENKSQEDTATQELGNPEYKVGLCLETRNRGKRWTRNICLRNNTIHQNESPLPPHLAICQVTVKLTKKLYWQQLTSLVKTKTK